MLLLHVMLLCGYFGLVLVIGTASNAAAHRAQHGMVPGIMPGNAAGDCTANATFGFSLDRHHDSGQRGSECDRKIKTCLLERVSEVTGEGLEPSTNGLTYLIGFHRPLEPSTLRRLEC